MALERAKAIISRELDAFFFLGRRFTFFLQVSTHQMCECVLGLNRWQWRLIEVEKFDFFSFLTKRIANLCVPFNAANPISD